MSDFPKQDDPALESAPPSAAWAEAARRGKGVYKSCAWIEGGAFISDKTVNMCCMEKIGNAGSPILLDIEGGSFSAGHILDARKALRENNQSPQAPCDGCYELKLAQWEAKDYLEFIAVSGFMHCNLACGYCVSYHFNPQDRGGNILPVMEEWISSGFLRAGSSIDWGGGESTLHRDFESVAQLAFAHQVRMLIFSNGTGFSPALADGLSRGLATIVCSVDAGTRETYKKIKVKDAFDRVWENLERYVRIRPDLVELKYIVMESNCTQYELLEFMRRAVGIGARNVIVSHNTYTNAKSEGHVSEEIAFAAAYLMVNARINGLTCKLADVFSVDDGRKINELVENWQVRGRHFVESLRRTHGELEITFNDSETFLDRALVAYDQGEPFRIVFGHRVEIARLPHFLVALMGGTLFAWDDRVTAGTAVPDLQAKLAAKLKDAWPSLPETLKKKALPLKGAKLDIGFDTAGEEIIGLEIRH